jgi:monoamine oxidase
MFTIICNLDNGLLKQLSCYNRKEALCAHYAWVFGTDDFLHPVDYREYNWMADQYSSGCYSSVMPPNVITKYGRYIRNLFLKNYSILLLKYR